MNKLKSKILIIDDEKGMQDMFKFLLGPHGYEVYTANNGLDGIELIKKSPFDVIFLDVHMPKMSGTEALKNIKQLYPDQIVIIMSSSSDPNFAFEQQAKQLGAYACLYKPFDIEEILNTIEKALSDKVE